VNRTPFGGTLNVQLCYTEVKKKKSKMTRMKTTLHNHFHPLPNRHHLFQIETSMNGFPFSLIIIISFRSKPL